MHETRKILILSADRAERGLLEPVMNEFKRRPTIEARWCNLDSKLRPTENLAILGSTLFSWMPDIVVVPCDRNEMVYAAAFAFQNNLIVCHFHAGNNNTNHPDDFNRRAISLFSHILLCNMQEHADNLIKQGEDKSRIHVVGSTAFDDIKFDDSSIIQSALLSAAIEKPFDLVILHPDPNSKERTRTDLRDTIRLVNDSYSRSAIWINPNNDSNSHIISDFLDAGAKKFQDLEVHQKIVRCGNLPRNQFLYLLSHCSMAVGNSSSFYYELPVVTTKKYVQFFPIGERNKNLKVPKTETGGSQHIADLLETIKLDGDLREKKML